jgi:hypothetical protein
MLPTKFRFIWPSDFRGEDFKKIGQSETVKLSWIWILTSLYVFLAHLAKGNVSFWHPLSIVR